VSVPDYISPIVGYRVWTWGSLGLKSLCGQTWHPGQSLAARCRASAVVGRAVMAHDSHDAPQASCTCGIHAVKTLNHFRSAGYQRFAIHGQVYLWGTVVEHELGYRAQFAYPKNFTLSPDALPFTLAEIRSRLQSLALYGNDIFVLGNGETLSLWSKSSGFDPTGLDCLIAPAGRGKMLLRPRFESLGLDKNAFEVGKEVQASCFAPSEPQIRHS
jgi:hypothetical protein